MNYKLQLMAIAGKVAAARSFWWIIGSALAAAVSWTFGYNIILAMGGFSAGIWMAYFLMEYDDIVAMDQHLSDMQARYEEDAQKIQNELNKINKNF